MITVRLHEAIGMALDAAATRLEGHRQAGGILEDVAKVHRAGLIASAVKFPLVTVFPGTLRPRDLTTFTIGREMPLRLQVEIQDTDPQRGYARCLDLVGRLETAMFTEPTTGEDDMTLSFTGSSNEEVVYAIEPGMVEPPAQSRTAQDRHLGLVIVNALIEYTT